MDTSASAPEFVHEALVYRDESGFLAGTVDFLREGVRAGEPVFALLSPDRFDRVRAGLGADAGAVTYLDLREIGRNPARIIPAIRGLAGSGPSRGVGEPVHSGRSDAANIEAQLHDALVNAAFDGTPLRLRCSIDARMPAAALDASAANHPVIVTNGTVSPSAGFDPKSAQVEFSADLPAPDAVSDIAHFALDDLPELRDLVTVRAGGFGLSRAKALDLTLATNEIVTNSICHGGERGTLRVWADGDAVVCEISDSGHIVDPMVGRTVPLPSVPGGRGVWLANQLCDLVQIRSSATGTVVRLHMSASPEF
ncbi:regulator of sigma factor [Alloactinosynnema sp. L-07]|uniref:sensor histidine kinase n=1 Tax=Alloactinosynnema sp. L-07 TaxID=1653480 RepID=UPI00065EF65B|nr:sensor histidine kinase [Alloactinosynnema sp. L-07]CRK57425.1 regulator of sigma factor [Alloactinosynnema sp. L-07]